MGRNIFVSYKYGDSLVGSLNKHDLKFVGGELHRIPRNTIVRDYVDELQKTIGADHINLGERDGESLEEFSDSTIETKLKEKIFRSSVTIVLISKGMKEGFVSEKQQWIPWEISYSLRIVRREDASSQTNAILGVVLPDESGAYDWYYTSNLICQSITHHTNQLFNILSKNMFNRKEKKFKECNGQKIHIVTEPSFIKTVRWDEFMRADNFNIYIEKAIEIRNNRELYNIEVNIG